MSLFAFGVTLAFAIALRWQAAEFIWGLWASSLLVGIATFFRALWSDSNSSASSNPKPSDDRFPNHFDGSQFNLTAHDHAGRSRQQFVRRHLGLGLVFIVSFLLVHWVYGALVDETIAVLGRDAAVSSWVDWLPWALRKYWPLIAMSLLDHLVTPLWSRTLFPMFSRTSGRIVAPYLDVIRIHGAIALFAILDAVNAGEFALYPVLFLYFIPWQTFWVKDDTPHFEDEAPYFEKGE